MRYELTDLRLFLEIAQAGSLSAGAAAVFITPSSASYRLKNLEQALGTPLFERTPRGMDLTPAGLAMLDHVRELFEGIERMQGDVGRFVSGLKGHIRLIANSSSLNGFVTHSLGRFLVVNPGIDADIDERQSEHIPAAVLAKEADIGIFAGPTTVEGLTVHAYAVDRLVLVTPRNHPLAALGTVRLGAALDFDFVCMSRATSNYMFLRDTAQKTGKALRARLHAHSFDTVLTLVAAGVGVALVPTSVLGDDPSSRGLTVIELDEPWALRELHLAVRQDARHPAFVHEFIRFLLEDPRVAITRAAASRPLAPEQVPRH